MKQGKHYTNLILWILLCAIVAYFGYNVVSSIYEPLSTSTAIEYEAGSGYSATGYVVRSESVIPSSYDITVLTIAEGERVTVGEPIATGYLSADAQSRQSQIAALQTQLDQLNYAYEATADASDQATLDTQILADLSNLAVYVARRDMNSVSDLSPELKGLVLRRSSGSTDADSIKNQIASVQSQLADLQSAAASDTKSVTAPASGYFSGTVDGYESVLTPDALQTLTVSQYNALQPQTVSKQNAGKLISGDTWYYVTVVPAGETADVEQGDTVQVSFARDFYNQIAMKVARIGDSEAGYRVLVLSCSEYMQDVTLLREQSADITFASYSGLRVPKDAVRVDEKGQPGVYVLEGASAKWKPITILHDNGESYVVKLDKTSTDNLWPGDEVIVNAKNLYDGKVVE
jgi:putative membrane fusion protein